MTNQIDQNPELTHAIELAKNPTPDNLEQLGRLSATVRNSEAVYTQLGTVTASEADRVINYIEGQCSREDDVLKSAVAALENINTPQAEKLIVRICTEFVKPTSQHVGYIGAECIVALQNMGTDSAADLIVQLGQAKDDLILQATYSLQKLYDGNKQQFQSQCKQMLEFATQREVLVSALAKKSIDETDIPNLRSVFARADALLVLPVANKCTRAFELALREHDLRQELKSIDADWTCLNIK